MKIKNFLIDIRKKYFPNSADKLERALQEVKDGKTVKYNSVDDLFEKHERERAEDKRNHPIRFFFYYHVWLPICRFSDKYLDIRNYYYEIKYFIQRGRRGWSNRDWWCTYYFICKVLKEMIKYDKKNGHGLPMWEEGMTEEEAIKKWADIQDKMIYAFESGEKIGNGDLELYAEWMWADDKAEFRDRIKKYHGVLQTKEEYDKMQEGFQLFIKHLWSLWD